MLVLRSTTFYVLERQKKHLRELEPLALRALNDHHDFLLENLLIAHKYLTINYYLSNEIAKGTNWEQKIQKPQDENICLTNLNVANNGNFPILAFGIRI